MLVSSMSWDLFRQQNTHWTLRTLVAWSSYKKVHKDRRASLGKFKLYITLYICIFYNSEKTTNRNNVQCLQE